MHETNQTRAQVLKDLIFLKYPSQVKEITQKGDINISADFFSSHGMTAPSVPGPPHSRGFTITLRHATLSRILWNSDQPDAETSN
jgi:hypothetical protein